MKEKVSEILNSKGYSNELIEFAIELLPEMTKLFGEEKIIKFFNEYTFLPRARNGHNSGATYRDKKIIEFDWNVKTLHQALTLFIHEAGHAIGILEAEKDSFLMEGFKMRESFLTKFEEAVVSERQDEIEFGELDYMYMEINNYENDEESHENDFKTQPTHKYTINKVFHKNIQILLGNNRDLINKMMFTDTLEEKSKICNTIIELLKSQLSEDEFLKLKDCVNVFTINYSYKEDKETMFDTFRKGRIFNETFTKEKCKELLIENFPKNMKYCMERNLLNKSIFTAVDDLCELTMDVLLDRLSNGEYDKFGSVKETCEYFSKIHNNSEKLSEKTTKLKSTLLDKIKISEPLLISKFNTEGLDEEETFEILTKIIARSDFEETDLSNIQINNNGMISISVSDKHQYFIEKTPVYSDYRIEGIYVEPIGYRTVLKENKQKQHKKEESLKGSD